MKNAFEYEAELAEEKKCREAAEGGWREANKVIAMQREKLDSLEAEIERLKGGAVEDCENCDGTGGVKVAGDSDSCPVCRGRGEIASQPAPVSLVLALRNMVGMFHHKATTPLELETVRNAESCLDKVKELNQ